MVGGKPYLFKVGGAYVNIRNEDKSRGWNPDIETVLGISSEEAEELRNNNSLSVLPSDIARFISENAT